MKPVIGITVGQIRNADRPWLPAVYGQAHTYSDAIERAGGIPFLIPLVKDGANLRQLYDMLQGVLFAGGNDINPELYGEKQYSSEHSVSKFRDDQEPKLLGWATWDNKPILGICRGMQLINVGLGGSLHQDIATDVVQAANHMAADRVKNIEHITHTLKIEANSKLASILNTQTIDSNSYHHQAVKNVAPGLVAVAWSEDGVIEGLESKDSSFVIGMQSHPEALESNVNPEYRKLFKSFVVAAGSSHKTPDISKFLASTKTPVLE